MNTDSITIINELNSEIEDHKLAIEKMKYDLEDKNLSEESIFAINSQISWRKGAINFALDTIGEIS